MQPCCAHTSLCRPLSPSAAHQVGSGKTALVTLLHEGGHAAHFANVDQHSPLFSQVGVQTCVCVWVWVWWA